MKKQKMTGKERKAELLQKLKKLEADICTDPAALQDFARKWTAGFHHYSFGNMLLAWTQKPDFSMLAGFNQWKSRGRYVKKGEKAIWILAPAIRKVKAEKDQEKDQQPADPENILEWAGKKDDPENGRDQQQEKEKVYKQIKTFLSVPVFDYKQTDGPPLDIGNKNVSGSSAYTIHDLAAYFPEHTIIFTAELSDGKTDGKNIWISERKNKLQQITTFLHELAHCKLEHVKKPDKSKPEKETEAEAVSNIVASCLGIENFDSTKYIGGWNEASREYIRKNAAHLVNTADQILRRILK